MAAGLDPFDVSGAAAQGATLERLRDAVASLAGTPHVVLVCGAPEFPRTCPNCGATARRSLDVQRAVKVYVADQDEPNVARVESFPVLFCDACIQKHEGAVNRPGIGLALKRLFFGPEGGEAFGGAIVLGVAFFFLKEAVTKVSFVLLMFAMLPASVGLILLRKNWKRNAYMVVPSVTDVTSAFEFTPSLAMPFERDWRAFRFRNRAYADLFRDANALHLWNPHGDEARQARAQRRASDAKTNRVIIAVVAVVITFGLWNEYGDYVLDLLDRLR